MGMLTSEGSWDNSSRFGYDTTAYGYGSSFLQVDATIVGTALTLKALSVRRDGTRATITAYVGRTVRFDVAPRGGAAKRALILCHMLTIQGREYRQCLPAPAA